MAQAAPPQEALVEAIAPALPAYGFTAEQWRDILVHLRLQSRGIAVPLHIRLFLEDVSRAADAMYNRLNGADLYLGKEELDKALGPVER